MRPDGVNFKLLELADDGLIDGFPTDVAAYEFVYNAYKGNLTRGDPVEDQQIVGIDDFDPTDLHLLVAAVEQDADIICTSNTTDFRQSAYGSIRVATPAALYREILDA